MHGAIGLIIYLAVMLLSSIVRMIAEQRAKQHRGQLGQYDEAESYVVTLEDILVEDGVPEEPGILIGDRTIEDDWDYGQDDDWEGLASEDTESQGAQGLERGFPSLAQAIVMSEIVREPRAIRRWPNR